MEVKNKCLTILALLAFCGVAESANILGVFTSHSPSHLIIHMTYAKILAERGHNVTVVTTIPLRDKNPLYHHIYIPPTEARLLEMEEQKSQMTESMNPLKTMMRGIGAVTFMGTVQLDVIKSQRFQDFMHNPGNKFDLLIVGYFFADYQLGLGLHFQCPIVISWMSATNYLVDRFVGNPDEKAYVPVSPLFKLPDLRTFVGRLTNYFISITSMLLTGAIDYQSEIYYNELFPDYPPLKEVRKNVSLLLSNSHFTEGIIRPNVPAVVQVGGIQIKDKPDPLPKDLQKIFNASSEHGVIYLSFGSNLGSTDLKPEMFQTIYKALAGLKQTVLWKWDAEEKPGNAPNIHYHNWLPQDDILAEPNLRLFITHAGKGSVSESEYHGVPMVAIPVFGDQHGNADQLAKDGYGVNVDRNTMTAEILRAAIVEVLENPKFKESVQQFSTLYRDRPMTARETAAYWIEYVIRHKGATHMQSPLVHLNWLQYKSVDVVAFLLVVAFLAYKLVKLLTTFLLRKVYGKFCSKQKVKKQ